MDSLNAINQKLISWYKENKRDLPWRATSDPYKIWISEIMLQQTQVKQGTGYYLRFIERFPDVTTLAKASEQEVLKYWQGLGYYSRARNLHVAAQQIVSSFHGVFPSEYQDIINLKGVGEYTAAAIVSIAYGKPYPVIDGNVARVISRLFNIAEPVNSTKGKKMIANIAGELLFKKDPGTYNQAVMEFGALHCTPSSPDCIVCILADYCEANQANTVSQLPVKLKKIRQRNRYFVYYLFVKNGSLIMRERKGKDVWKGLWEFPLIEFNSAPDDMTIIDSLEKEFNLKADCYHIKSITRTGKHMLSHQIIHGIFVLIQTSKLPDIKGEYHSIETGRVTDYPVSRLIDKFLQIEDVLNLG